MTTERYSMKLRELQSLHYETPYFLMAPSAAVQNLANFRQLFPDATIHYAVKANSDQEVVSQLADVGANFEIASYDELEYLQKLGIAVDRVIYSNPVKPARHIELAHEAGLRAYAVDSAGELEKIARSAPGAAVYVRLAVDGRGSTFCLSRKFGTTADECETLLLKADALGLEAAGLTFHVGSQQTDPQTWVEAIRAVGEVMAHLLARGLRVRILNISGGFPVPYRGDEPALETIAKSIYAALRRYLPYPVELWLEPGRAIVAATAVAVTTIIGHSTRTDEEWLYVDLGAFHGMLEALQTGGELPYPCRAMPQAMSDSGCIDYTVTGPTCDPDDLLYRRVRLPAGLREGDKIAIFLSGAYTLGYASAFNGFPVPPTYYVDEL